MSDFTQLPVKDGFKGCFDYTNYDGGDTWLNQYADGSGINFNMSNAVKSDGCILFPELQGMCYLIDDIGNTGLTMNMMMESQETMVGSIQSMRENYMGVSQDEELSFLMKAQNAYNASSRFFNVINEMLQTVVQGLG